MPQLRFYYREGCHLCDDMWQQLQELHGETAFDLQAVSISGHPELEAAYGTLIPVLQGGEEILCHYYLDPMALERFLSAEEKGEGGG